jgi:hypothetical protein
MHALASRPWGNAISLDSKFSRTSLETFLDVVSLTRRPVVGGGPNCLHLSVAAIFISEECRIPWQASTGILLRHESLFGLHRCWEPFLD